MCDSVWVLTAQACEGVGSGPGVLADAHKAQNLCLLISGVHYNHDVALLLRLLATATGAAADAAAAACAARLLEALLQTAAAHAMYWSCCKEVCTAVAGAGASYCQWCQESTLALPWS